MKMLSLKRKVKIEKSSPTTLRWQICADDTEWKASHAQPPRPSHLPLDAVPMPDSAEAGGQRGQSWLFAIRRWLPLGIAVTLLAALGMAGWVQAQIGLAKIDREVQDAAEADLWLSLRPASFAETDRGRGEFVDEAKQVAALLETSTTGEVTTRSEIAEMGDGWVRVHLHVQSGTDNNGYHQTRVYRQTDAGWQRVPPAAAYWGKAQQLETRYFIWHYFAQDDEVVNMVAPTLDLLYPDFFAALLPPAGSDKLQVQLDPERIVNGTNPIGETPSTPLQGLLIPSPSAMLLPDTLEPEAWLTQAVALALFDHLAAAAVEEYDLPPHWAPIRDGLRLELMWKQKLPLAVWRESFVQWVFGGLHAKANISLDSPPPPFASDLCTHHRWWMASADDIGSPIFCFTHPNEQERILAFRHPYPLSVRLVQLIPSIETAPYMRSQQHQDEMIPPTAAVAFATFFEYVRATYGDEKVRLTLAALPQFESWEALIPAVYGVSLPEFEVGWNTYLAQEEGSVP